MGKRVVIRKVPAEPGPADEGLPPWMATFADMVTLLLCFFVLLLSFAEQDAQKFRDVVGSLRDAFGAEVVRSRSPELGETTTSTTRDKAAPASDDAQVMTGAIIRLQSLMAEDESLKRNSGIAADREGVLMQVNSGIVFPPGSARLTGSARAVLDRVVAVLREYPVNLVVRGHTGSESVTGDRYPSNWELSAARAANALAYIVEIGGINVNRVKAVGYADTRPVRNTATAAGRRANERVEFYFHKPERDSW